MGARVANCVACGGAASHFCGGCGVTPYCTAGCQRRDYSERHRQVCHNLKRSVGGTAVSSKLDHIAPADDVALLPAALPLRRPRSPDVVKRERHSDDSGSERAPNPNHKFGPPGSVGAANYKNARTGGGQNGARPGQAGGRDGQPRPSAAQDGAKNNRNDRFDNRKPNHDGDRPSRPSDRLNNRGQDRRFDNRAPPKEEEWGTKPTPKPEPKSEPKPEPKPAPKPVETPIEKPKSPAVQLVEPKLQPKLVREEVKAKPTPDVVNSAQLVPKNCLIDLLSVNDTFTLAVQSLASECRAGTGFVCLSLNEEWTEQYMQLLQEEFTASCQASQTIKPKPGESFVYFNPADEGWYRARCVSADTAALLDACRLVALDAAAQCRALPRQHAAPPEYCCLLAAPAAQINDSFKCTVVSKSGGTLSVSLENIATGAPQGSGTVQRWLPAVEHPAAPAAAPSAPSIPEVPRPPLTDKSRVILVDATEPNRLFVRSSNVDSQKEFDDVGMEVAVYGMTAKPMTEPPTVGQTVVAKYTDEMCYRALCRRVNSKLNKYLLEYIEYGNTTVAFLEGMYPCPPELTLAARPTLVSQATLQMSQKSFNDAATQFLDGLKNEATELILSIPSGAASAPSGNAVRLSVAQSGADVNRTVSALCTPEWVKLLERGGDVMGVRAPVFDDLTYVDLPASNFELEVLETSMLEGGSIAGHARGAPHAAKAFALADPLGEYCSSSLCKEPYLPKAEELCVALCPKRNRWVRAALLQQDGAGSASADLLLFDYGDVAFLPVSQLRKMMPEFVTGLPAACCSIEIKDFPKNPTEPQLALARQHMNVNARGVGSLRVARAVKQAPGEYVVEAPELIRAMMA